MTDKIKEETNQADVIIQQAFDAGVEVRWAKRTADIQEEGIHLMDPSFERMVEGLCYALMHGVDLVMVHSKTTWARSLRLVADDGAGLYSIPEV
jgi:hypothetical protein